MSAHVLMRTSNSIILCVTIGHLKNVIKPLK